MRLIDRLRMVVGGLGFLINDIGYQDIMSVEVLWHLVITDRIKPLSFASSMGILDL